MAEQPPVYDAGFLPNGKPKDRKLSLAARQRQAVDLRKAGYTFDAIATAIGYANKSAAWKAVHAALHRQEYESVSALRQLEATRLDQIQVALWPRAIAGDLKAIDGMLRVMARRASLFGLDAPRRQEITGREGGPVEIMQRSDFDFSVLSDAELEHLAALAERVMTGEVDR
jgi:hypothetical protein